MELEAISCLTISTNHLHKLLLLIQVIIKNVKLESSFKVPYCMKYIFPLLLNGKSKLLFYYIILHTIYQFFFLNLIYLVLY